MTSIDPYAPPLAPLEVEVTGTVDSPHALWRQIIGLSIASVIALLIGGVLGGVPLMLTGIFTFVDAWTAGIYKRPHSKSFLNISPMAWAVAMDGLLIVAFPLYLMNRNKLKTREGVTAYFVLMIIFGFLTFAVIGLGILAVAMQTIVSGVS